MRLFIILIVLLINMPTYSDDLIYLECKGVAKDKKADVVQQEVKNDLLINKSDKTIRLVITGLSEKETESLKYKYKETPTQYISEDGSIAINKHTLEYSVTLLFSRINGTCTIKKPQI